MPPKNRTLTPAMAETAYNLRVAGMSERAIYEQFRDTFSTPPSYRDLRALYRQERVYYRHDVADARRFNAYATTRARERPLHEADYLDRLKTTRRVDRRAEAKDDLDRNYVLGLMARSGVAPQEVEDPNLRDSLESIYDGFGS